MRINSKDKIASVPILDVRNYFRRLTGSSVITTKDVQKALDIDLDTAKKVIASLADRDFLKLSPHAKQDEDYWMLTSQGAQFKLASAARPVKRSTADRVLKEFLERVKHLNEDSDYLYRVPIAVVFGSYLDTTKDRLGDLDVAILLKANDPEPDGTMMSEAFLDLCYQRADQSGRSFASYIEKTLYARKETIQYLKSRSRTLSLHDLEMELKVGAFSDAVEEVVPAKVVYASQEGAPFIERLDDRVSCQ